MYLLTRINEIINNLKGNFSPDISGIGVRKKQLLMSAGVIGISILGLSSFLLWRSDTVESKGKVEKPVVIESKKISTPLKSVDERDIWVSRVEERARQVQAESEKVRQENQVLEKRLDVLEELLRNTSIDQKIADEEATKKNQIELEISHNSEMNMSTNQFPMIDEASMTQENATTSAASIGISKIGHVSRDGMSGSSFKTVDSYLPATTTVKAVMTSGVVAPAGPESKNNPKPVTLRLVDDGSLPRGFTSRVKGAEVNAACYGDISTERVECRLVSMTWVEPNGTIIERDIEGWIYGEDGSEGLRGKIVDRSGDVAREAYFAGILSGFANFFKFEAQNSVYPVSPFGVTNALNPGNALQSAAGAGVSNAMEKLADRSLKRLDQMQPVIVIHGGRLVDVRFKTGFSLSPHQSGEMKLVGQNNQEERES